MRPLIILLSIGTGCSSSGTLQIEPTELDWGVIDFHNEDCMNCACSEGCSPTDLFLTNTGEAPLSVWMPKGFDDTHLCINGYTSETQLSLGELQPDEFYLLRISVCGYESGELNTPEEDPPRPVTGELVFSTDGEPSTAEIPYSFVPTRNQ